MHLVWKFSRGSHPPKTATKYLYLMPYPCCHCRGMPSVWKWLQIIIWQAGCFKTSECHSEENGCSEVSPHIWEDVQKKIWHSHLNNVEAGDNLFLVLFRKLTASVLGKRIQKLMIRKRRPIPKWSEAVPCLDTYHYFPLVAFITCQSKLSETSGNWKVLLQICLKDEANYTRNYFRTDCSTLTWSRYIVVFIWKPVCLVCC